VSTRRSARGALAVQAGILRACIDSMPIGHFPAGSSPLIYVASAAKLGRTTEEYRRILREDHITIRGAQ
jgi:hypothetical protein